MRVYTSLLITFIIFFTILVKEYRDIPPYRDNPTEDEDMLSNGNGNNSSSRLRNDDKFDYESTNRNEALSGKNFNYVQKKL